MNLEANPTNPENQAELAAKKKKLKDLETKQKQLDQQLPLTTQITILEQEIQTLTQKPTKTQAEEALLASKKKELAELLAQQSNTTNNSEPSADKVVLYWGIGIIAVVLFGLVLILLRKKKKRNKY